MEQIEIVKHTITIAYDIDAYANVLKFEYDTISLDDPALRMDAEALRTYAVSLGIICLGRFGAILPHRFDITKYAPWAHPHLLNFFRKTLPFYWSEHRYQLNALGYRGPEFIFDEAVIGSKAKLPIWQIKEPLPRRVMVASGSGKDSLLCEKILEEAGVEYELFAYLYDLYGNVVHQKNIYDRVLQPFSRKHEHSVRIYDNYNPWLKERLASYRVVETMNRHGIIKNFNMNSSEILMASLSMVPIQVIRGIPLQVFGHEKSADFSNLTDRKTDESISHQFGKSFHSERYIVKLYKKLFNNISKVSIIKPMHDVLIFKLLFELAGDLPYLTNSCNVKKPWCLRCDKCLYVFSGFTAFGDPQKTIEAFGADLLDDLEVLSVWEELLGLRGHIAWECVGHPEETQLYFYKALGQGVTGCAIDMFKDKIIGPMTITQEPTDIHHHFGLMEQRYSKVHPKHHHMPEWLSEQVLKVLTTTYAGWRRHPE